MRGKHAFCPRSGVELNPHRDRVPSRSGLRNMRDPDGVAEPLTQGANYSRKNAIKRRFKHCYKRTHSGDLDATLYRQAALAIDRLGSLDPSLHDDYLWYALRERLHRHYDEPVADLDWMASFVEPGCPACDAMLKWERSGDGWMRGRCTHHCITNGDYVDHLIIGQVIEGYNRAFHRGDTSATEISELATVEHKNNPPQKTEQYLAYKRQLTP